MKQDTHTTTYYVPQSYNPPDCLTEQLPVVEPQAILAEARTFTYLCHCENGTHEVFAERIAQIQTEIERVGTYWQTTEELAYGAKMAWRNSTRCIGRLHWKTLIVRDLRHLQTAEDIFNELVEHLRLATNGGRIRPMISIFAPQVPGQPGIRIWNPQLIRYAGYVQPDGSVIGDPLQVELTRHLYQLGWKEKERTPFDLLPIIIQMPHQPPRVFELPRDAVLEIPISHPYYPWFEKLGLKWYALPVISDMRLEIGGLHYTAAPFNGWYMGTEIGARNFGDSSRYNLLPVIAEKLGFDTRSERTLWRDRALVELNVAVLASFARYGVTVVDHHTASRQFVLHEAQENLAGRTLRADWGWIVPPLSGSATPVFHRSYKDRMLTPNFFYQAPPWKREGPDQRWEVEC